MLDTTLCPGTDCPLREGCLRYRAKPVARFVAFTHAPYDPERRICDSVIDLASLRPTPAQIERRAYDLWLAAGRPEGDARAHWDEAEATLEARFHDSFE